MAQPIKCQALVDSIVHHADGLATLNLKTLKKFPKIRPGQFIHLSLEIYDGIGFWPDSRAFSVANAVLDKKTICLTVSRQGDYTNRIILETKPGMQVWLKGPYGNFFINDDEPDHNAVLIAGGTGVTPFCSYCDKILSHKSSIGPVDVFYGAKHEDLLIYKTLLDSCSAKFKHFNVNYFIEEGGREASQGVSVGSLNIRQIVQSMGILDNKTFYLSGPKLMISDFRDKLLNEFLVSEHNVKLDEWT